MNPEGPRDLGPLQVVRASLFLTLRRPLPTLILALALLTSHLALALPGARLLDRLPRWIFLAEVPGRELASLLLVLVGVTALLTAATGLVLRRVLTRQPPAPRPPLSLGDLGTIGICCTLGALPPVLLLIGASAAVLTGGDGLLALPALRAASWALAVAPALCLTALLGTAGLRATARLAAGEGESAPLAALGQNLLDLLRFPARTLGRTSALLLATSPLLLLALLTAGAAWFAGTLTVRVALLLVSAICQGVALVWAAAGLSFPLCSVEEDRHPLPER